MGTGCFQGLEGPGIAHSAAAFLAGANFVAPINGMLLVVSYKVMSSTGFSRIDVIHSIFGDGSPTPVPHTTLPGIYGTEPAEFIVSVSPNSITVLQGFNVSTTITVNSTSGFAGAVSLNASKEFGTVFGKTVLNLTPNGSNSTQLTFLAPWSMPARDYPQVTVTGSNGVQSRSIFIDVNVKIRDFQLAINPSGLKIHGGSFANTTITLQSQNEFSGNVSLLVQAPANVSYVLSSSVVFVGADAASHTFLNITAPVLSLPFRYIINVTASASLVTPVGVRLLSHLESLFINPPAPSFAISVNPATIVVRAGLTSTVTITVTSVDYFWQYVYLSATMSGGKASFDINSYYMPLPDSKYSNFTASANFTLAVFISANQVPGHYIVLLTVYQNPLTRTIGIPVTITALSHNASTPTVFGLTPPVYFGTVGFLIIPLIILGISTYRKNRADKDEDWKA